MSAGLDPTAVLSSPMLASRFKVRRRSAGVGANGRTTHQDEVISWTGGVVSPIGANGQKREESGSHGETTYSVITRFRLRKQAEGVLPDVVLYAGQELLVIDVEDYSRYGRGWVQATCTSQRIVDARVGANTP